jgi:predicted DNA-binding protein YlxM (UPF0122 family)
MATQKRLTKEDRFLIGVMRFLGYTQKEIAKELGITRSAVQYQLRQRKKKAKEIGVEKAFWKEVEEQRNDLLNQTIQEEITGDWNKLDTGILSKIAGIATGGALLAPIGVACGLILAQAMEKRKEKVRKNANKIR